MIGEWSDRMNKWEGNLLNSTVHFVFFMNGLWQVTLYIRATKSASECFYWIPGEYGATEPKLTTGLVLASKEGKWVITHFHPLLKLNLKWKKFNTKYNSILFIVLVTTASAWHEYLWRRYLNICWMKEKVNVFLFFPQSGTTQDSQQKRTMLIAHRALELAETIDRLAVRIHLDS